MQRAKEEKKKNREDDKSVITSAIDSERLIALITLWSTKALFGHPTKREKDITIQRNNDSYSQDNKKEERALQLFMTRKSIQRSLWKGNGRDCCTVFEMKKNIQYYLC